MTHCAARLRLNLKDDAACDDAAVKEVEGVVNTLNKAGQYQVLIGTEVPKLYEKFEPLVKGSGVEISAATKDEGESIVSQIFSAISGIFAPLLPAMAGSGILRGFVILAAQLGIIAEGTDIWNGAGDRGDAAMCANGAARYALARADRTEAEELWPLVEWCLEYCNRKLTPAGVVASNSDELENRFPAGDANLCTSTLYYDALRSAVMLGRELGISAKQLNTYRDQANALEKAIEKHFGYEIEGFHSYRYYEGNDILRSWICMPLVMGIYTRTQGTIDALFSPRLWTDDGLLTQAGTETFWDRSTLYALRGTIAAGEVEKGMNFLKKYSHRRLLGDHVPYAIEAWPEGDQRHLSAESGLYCRIYTEGLFGIRPTGLRSFGMTPRRVRRAGKKLHVEILKGGKPVLKKSVTEGATIKVNL